MFGGLYLQDHICLFHTRFNNSCKQQRQVNTTHISEFFSHAIGNIFVLPGSCESYINSKYNVVELRQMMHKYIATGIDRQTP